MSPVASVEDSVTSSFSVEDDLVTARDLATGIAASGSSRSEALAMLADALELHEGGGEPIEDEEEFLRNLGIDPEDTASKDLPEFMQ